MTALSSFEVLAESLIPQNVTPLTNIPFVIQAYFVQVSYPTAKEAVPIQFDLTFEETTNFNQGVGQSGLIAQFLNEEGLAINYAEFFTPGLPNGFQAQQIAPGQTKIYSVTVLPPSGAPRAAAPIPQDGTGWRGIASLTPSTSGLLVATPTQRQIYFSADMQTITDSVVYAVPTVSGGTLI
ncbi:MAG: hypothetical protein ACK5QQ_13540 [Cyanobacteriota bacterium]